MTLGCVRAGRGTIYIFIIMLGPAKATAFVIGGNQGIMIVAIYFVVRAFKQLELSSLCLDISSLWRNLYF